ncbi:MAG TPA: hypothetical protein VIS56_00650, partial [Candidatus Saccharimonadales bacterium]
TYEEVNNFVWQREQEYAGDDTIVRLSPVDIYQRSDEVDNKQITLRLDLTHYKRTLTDQEVNNLLDKIAAAAKEELGAERV